MALRVIVAKSVLLLLGLIAISEGYRPVVLMHGIAASASSMDPVVSWIQSAHPGTYVKNVEIGDGYFSSFVMPMDQQVESFCQQLTADTNLTDQEINLIGYSQGGLISRGFIERCNNPPVHNFITWSTPHGGQFGIPFTGIWVDPIVGQNPYDSFVQEHFTFAEYWRDPFQLEAYLEKCIFLPYIDNLVNYTDSYKQNIASLANFVMLYSTNDTIIKPQQSGWFSTYAANSTTVIPLNQQDIYQQDLIGLRTLDESSRLHFVTNDCQHQDYPTQQCQQIFEMYTLPWLD